MILPLKSEFEKQKNNLCKKNLKIFYKNKYILRENWIFLKNYHKILIKNALYQIFLILFRPWIMISNFNGNGVWIIVAIIKSSAIEKLKGKKEYVEIWIFNHFKNVIFHAKFKRNYKMRGNYSPQKLEHLKLFVKWNN